MLARSRDLGRRFDSEAFPLAALEELQRWQQSRFRRTYADFLARESDAPACRFFLEELYGGSGFRQRDEDVEKVAPVMIRLLPAAALDSLTEAFRLQVVSLELDIAMVETEPEGLPAELDEPAYARLYRACGRRRDRELQIELIRSLGLRLERLVKTPLLLRLLAVLRSPAHAAGFGNLQEFLEDGLGAFRQLDEPRTFVESIYRREHAAMERLFDGAPQPFEGLIRV